MYIRHYYPIYKIIHWYLNMCCYIWMQHLLSKGIIILSSCHKYLGKHVHIDSVVSQEDCDYINLVLGKYQYTETSMANLDD